MGSALSQTKAALTDSSSDYADAGAVEGGAGKGHTVPLRKVGRGGGAIEAEGR
eukprot:CAMPEP_0174358066 /NCGR_PEP_ID=MMETSP0811_2-20130205/39713_1 /TAXON_ID=73025 ORGANISM="Eutreptiella gymnastica-like, Strain CCMP1594" /NCGR_SAMPLE_ID=MMETSP0811_2 /ASSEMBLY_ACC=CAM_ASM_000667 /LENGTH=52 /DNA_ID=CAMNT_0015491459 /DNA_START=72 /DNA_END=227 /DNA_ORIENTATION=-